MYNVKCIANNITIENEKEIVSDQELYIYLPPPPMSRM